MHPQLIENYYTPGAKLEGRCLYPFLHARVSFSGKVYFCPFIRVEVGDLATSSLEEIWNGERTSRCDDGWSSTASSRSAGAAARSSCRRSRWLNPFAEGVAPAARHPADGRSMTAADMLGRHTLLINPPLINGVAFTRQGRCQEREDVLGTTKPPYTLALLAALLRNAGCDVRLIDATAERLSIDEVIARLDGEGFLPTLIVFPEHDADARRRRRRRWRSSSGISARRCSASARTPRRRRPSRWQRAPDVDGMFVGEPEEALLAARRARFARPAAARCRA